MVRFKNRYIVVDMQSGVQDHRVFSVFHPGLLKNVIIDKVTQVHGDFGAAAIQGGFQLKYCNKKTSILILRVRHGPHRILASTLPLIQQSPKGHLQLNTLYTSGTMLHCYKFMRLHQTGKLHRLWASLSELERADLEKAFAGDGNKVIKKVS